MKCRKCGTTGPAARPPVPPWLDPAPALASGAVRVTMYSHTVAGVWEQIATPNPNRAMIGFCAVSTIAAYEIRPAGASFNAHWSRAPDGGIVWFTAFNFGPVINLAWEGRGEVLDYVDVWEVYLTR